MPGRASTSVAAEKGSNARPETSEEGKGAGKGRRAVERRVGVLVRLVGTGRQGWERKRDLRRKCLIPETVYHPYLFE